MKTMQIPNPTNIKIANIISIAKQAADAAMKCINSGLKISIKKDGSKVTNADLAANSLVTTGLSKLTQDIPILSEESCSEFDLENLKETFWCVDPIDGTDTMISYSNGNKEHTGFAVNIALVHNGKPVKGVVYYPSRDEVYYTGDDDKAYKTDVNLNTKIINSVKANDYGPLKASVGYKKEDRPISIKGREVEYVPEVGGGRMLKVAESSADVAWLNFKMALWDLAASHAVLKAAGGDLVLEENGKDVDYTNSDFTIEPTIGAHLDTLVKLGYKKP